MEAGEEGLWFLPSSEPDLQLLRVSRKMPGGLLLRLLLTMALCPGLCRTGSVQNLHLCEGYMGPDGRSHPGFYCPRLTDPAGHRYCCRPGPRTLKSCCSQAALEALTGVNLSSLAGPGLLRNPLALPFVGLYGLLILLLMAIDLVHFYRTRSCRLLPLGSRLPRGLPGGHRLLSRSPQPRGNGVPGRG
ncbi:protein shisa-like-1a [Melopsittacus undulatus]|uniref:protein shisa-like-1a n=1 Tax=Melopsittacus undulatus TaxID=13146 RepID=UPI001469F973|nr:protein shisa-like-1a [Melopsittacus undulatus]